MKKKGLAALLAVVVLAIGAYWYWSPILVVHRLVRASERGDAEAVNDRVDYPALRESLKGQFAARVADEGKSSERNPFSSLGSMVGMAMANQMIDTLVRPEMMVQVMRAGSLRPKQGASGSDESPAWEYQRAGPNRLIAFPRWSDKGRSDQAVGLVFQRRGFADWRLVGIRLPPAA
jgi:hypothetical protein